MHYVFRRYYKEQDLLITTFEDFKQNKFNEDDDSAQHSKKVSILAKLSFAVNLVCLMNIQSGHISIYFNK